MSIRKRVEDALLLYKNGRHEGAFLTALVAVAATARREYPNRKMTDRECFETFLNKRHRGILQVEFRGELHTIPYIFYKWFRCELVHEGGLPMDVEFIDSAGLAALVHTLKLLQQRDKFLICGAQGPVKHVFELTRMDRVFQMYTDEKAAIAALTT